MVDVGKVDGVAIDDIGKINFMDVPAGGVSFTDYHHYEDLASGSSYTPTVASLSVLCNENLNLSNNDVHVEFWDGGGWVNGHPPTALEATCNIFQDDSQNVRVYNADGAAKKISLTGVIWAGSTDYHHYEDLAPAGTTYTPTAESIASFFNEAGRLDSVYVNVEFWDGGAWVATHSSTELESSRLIFQDNAQNIRIINNRGATAYKISLTGIVWT